MAKESDQLANHVACLATENMAATLISTSGYHCDVWRSIGAIVRDDRRETLDFVIKVHRGSCSFHEARVYRRQYRVLKDALGEIIPDALFVSADIDGDAGVMVLAETVTPWFNIANPNNESETIPLLRRLSKARGQLARFISAAEKWQSGDSPRVIDLYGYDNLVLDKNYNVRFLDSFEVFFIPDMLEMFDEVDVELESRIDISLRRQEYLRYILEQSTRAGD